MSPTKKRVLVIGLEPTLVDFSTMPDLNADKVRRASKPTRPP